MSNDNDCGCTPESKPPAGLLHQMPAVIIAEDAWPEADPNRLTVGALEQVRQAIPSIALAHRCAAAVENAPEPLAEHSMPAAPIRFLLGSRKLPIPGST